MTMIIEIAYNVYIAQAIFAIDLDEFEKKKLQRSRARQPA